MKDIKSFSDSELQAELARREKEYAEKVKKFEQERLLNPYGLWRIQTEGDVEGRSMLTLADCVEGHIGDLALLYSRSANYKLYFKPLMQSVDVQPRREQDSSARICFEHPQIHRWSKEEHLRAVKNLLGPDWKVEDGQYYQTVEISPSKLAEK